MKPIIGIFPSYDKDKHNIFLDQEYIDAVIQSGGIPFVIPLSENEKNVFEALEQIDGLILSGGTDINPKYYGEENVGKSLGINDFLDKCEAVVIRLAMEADIPVLGICRGMQALNVFCGGSLIQDIPSERGVYITHSIDKPDMAFHKISIEKASPLSDAIGFGNIIINSYHHQAVKNVAADFSSCAISEDGIIEAIYHKNKKFVLGVQWHPERSHETASDNKKIIDYFIKVCKKHT